MSNISLSVIIPVYNEEKSLLDSVLTTLSVLDSGPLDYELIIVNDGSTDDSKEIINLNFEDHKKITIHHKQTNGGFGSAVKAGIQLASKENILIIPVDSPLSNETFKSFYLNINKADIIVGCRTSRKGYSLRMKLNSIIFHWLVSKMFAMKLKDYNWIHLYKTRIFKSNDIQIESNGIFMLAEVLIKAKRMNFTFFEISVEHNERIYGIPTASGFMTSLKTAKDLFSFFFSGRIK
jgi:glycosyltransferase involved in cell wall biosynthesis